MTGLVTTAIVLACIGAYLLAGYRIAMWQLPQSWAAARREWSGERTRRESVREQTWALILLWPVVAPVRVAHRHVSEVVDSRDPDTLAQQVADRDKRIAQLERELGIGRP